MRYFFADIETMNASNGYAHLQIVDHYADIPPLKVIKIVDGEEVVEEVEDTVSQLYAEKMGGVLEVKSAPRKATKSASEPTEPADPKDGK